MDPTTCAEASAEKSYIGCDYWPTVTANGVWSVFDFAVVVSNPGASAANVTITGGALTTPVMKSVPAGMLVEIGLPWVFALKGQDVDAFGSVQALTSSMHAVKGAYHLVSDTPVLVYQFSPLEYEPGTGNDLQGMPWSSCPAASGLPCYSYTNDASLLIPSTAMTANYVVAGIPGNDYMDGIDATPLGSSYAVITATVDGTSVKMKLGPKADILGSDDKTIPGVPQNMTAPATVTYEMNAGDVIELVGSAGSTRDYTGSIIEATQPVQLIVGNPATSDPATMGTYTEDHIEETVLPIETWGKSYVVTAPSGPLSLVVEHQVRIYGGAVASNVTYVPPIMGAPATLAPESVYTFTTQEDFYVSGDQPFAISTEMLSAQVIDPSAASADGDPSLSFFSAIEQYRVRYLFLAPPDYDTSYVNITLPSTATLMLDGVAVTAMPSPIGGGYTAIRLPLTPGPGNGAHTLVGSAPFGIQVIGYGAYTSYQYPGGLNLKVIGAPPRPIQ